ncbi:MAG: class I SAM-dependent methyltransferase [Actinomycetota bacterium]|nr:class I SAM-dependent methyltransferase [Actinomycetota bacterium]
MIQRSRREQWRAERALARQLDYQRAKAKAAEGHEHEFVAAMVATSRYVRQALAAVRPLDEAVRVLEVGSGAHGLVFYFGSSRGIGIDPLAAEYAGLFPVWQHRAPTVAATGSALPFPDGSFDIVLCDNVVDHAHDPPGIVRETARVLAPGGVLYFTVNVHHPIYALAAWMHAAANDAGLRLEVGPFADHTVHLTPAGAQRLFRGLPLRAIHAECDPARAKERDRRTPPRHAGDNLKRLFYKNAVFTLIAERT